MKIIKPKTGLQSGFMLLEALVAILIFAFGILGLVALGSLAISAQSDAEYRTEAAILAGEIASTIALNVDRSGLTAQDIANNIQTSLAAFQHQPGGANCTFSGAQSANAEVLAWVAKVGAASSGLPGVAADGLQIKINPMNEVEVTVCWKSPKDTVRRRFTQTTYVN